MKVRTLSALVGILATCYQVRVGAQDAAQPKFDVASIKPNRSESNAMNGANFVRNGRLTMINCSLKGLVGEAFGVAVLNLPDWTASAKYDINATTSDLAATTRALLQGLLKDRFHFAAHYETRDVPTYELVIARPDGRLGAGLHRSTANCDAPAPPGERPCGWSGSGPVPLHWGKGSAIDLLIASLVGSVERRVVDKTGLSGPFDWEFQTQRDPNDNSAPSIFTALQEQLGLKLQPARGTIDVIVVDHVEPPTPD
jgi:uncharacterized protein (TIGR03435 family)